MKCERMLSLVSIGGLAQLVGSAGQLDIGQAGRTRIAGFQMRALDDLGAASFNSLGIAAEKVGQFLRPLAP